MKKILLVGLLLSAVSACTPATPPEPWELRAPWGWQENVTLEKGVWGATTCFEGLNACWVEISKEVPAAWLPFTRAHEFGHVMDFYNGRRGAKLYAGAKSPNEAFANAFGKTFISLCGRPTGEPALNSCVQETLLKVEVTRPDGGLPASPLSATGRFIFRVLP